jgi:iron complex transport system ATP-binding protein
MAFAPRPAPATGEASAPALSVLAGSHLILDGRSGQSPRLDDVSVRLESGQVAAIVGPNGAGKSSLLAVLAGILRPRTGDVRLDGRSLLTLPRPHLARSVAAVGPWTLPDSGLTVREVVALGRVGQRASVWQDPAVAGAGAVRDALAATHLEALAGAPLGTLSAGERQRARLAAALAQGARFLLLDEPTASLDPGHAQEAMTLLVQLARGGHGIGVVLHDLTAAGQFADVVHLMARGCVRATGATATILEPGLLREAYGTSFDVFPHPLNGRPVVVWAATGTQGHG